MLHVTLWNSVNRVPLCGIDCQTRDSSQDALSTNQPSSRMLVCTLVCWETTVASPVFILRVDVEFSHLVTCLILPVYAPFDCVLTGGLCACIPAKRMDDLHTSFER